MNPCLCRKSNPGLPLRSLVTIVTGLPRLFDNKDSGIILHPLEFHIHSQLAIQRCKIKVKLSLCLTKHHAAKGEWRYSSTHSLTSALGGGEWSASRLITPRETAPSTHWTGGWVGPRAVLNAVVKRKIPSPPRIDSP
jgi:hypothetical protein